MRLADLCARSEQCESDLRRKIRLAGLTTDEADRIIEALQSGKFLDDARFARAYARDKVRFAGWGAAKIRMGLAAKRITGTLATQAIEAIDRREYIDALKRAALAKARSLDLTSREDVQKLYTHLAQRGFESQLISRITDYLRKDR